MYEQNDLAQKRDAIIERIKQVFPKNPPGKGKKGVKIVTGRFDYEARKLIEVFEGKRWGEMAAYPGVIYLLSGLDYVGSIDNKAYLYYLPAFLVAALNEPLSWENISGPLDKIYWLMPKFSLDHLDILIPFFEYQILIRNYYEYDWDTLTISRFETVILHLMIRRDELAKEQAK